MHAHHHHNCENFHCQGTMKRLTRAKKTRSKKSSISSLPEDLLFEVTMQVASKSSAPLRDLRSLRATCKTFYRVSKEKLVGRSLAVGKLNWWEKEAYLQLLRNCADCGNVDAYFFLGFEEIYNARKAISGLQHLERAMIGGHFAAAYFMGMVLFRHDTTRPYAMDILNRVASGDLSASKGKPAECTRSGNPIVDRCRREVLDIVRRNWWKDWEMQPRNPCPDQLCGRVVKASTADCNWVERDCRPRAFCSQACRWGYEAKKFFDEI